MNEDLIIGGISIAGLGFGAYLLYKFIKSKSNEQQNGTAGANGTGTANGERTEAEKIKCFSNRFWSKLPGWIRNKYPQLLNDLKNSKSIAILLYNLIIIANEHPQETETAFNNAKNHCNLDI